MIGTDHWMLWRLRLQNQRWRIHDSFLVGKNLWRAQRYGMDRGSIDFGQGHVTPFAELMDGMLEPIAQDAEASGCYVEVQNAHNILSGDNSSTYQRAVFASAFDNSGNKAAALRAATTVITLSIDEFTADLQASFQKSQKCECVFLPRYGNCGLGRSGGLKKFDTGILMTRTTVTRRALLGASLATLAAPSILRAQNTLTPTEEAEIARHNISSFRPQYWQDHFDTPGIATIVVDIDSRALHYWNADGTDYRLYPTSVPLTEELTRHGHTKIVRKKVGPTWTPTASMRERDPSLPKFMDAGEGNPLGTHAMYLDWPAYLIHGTHDTRKIGRRSSSGCIGLYNKKIAELFAITPVGTQVRLL